VAGLVAAVALALMLVRTGQGGGWFALLLMLPAAFLLWIGAGPVLDRLFASAPGEELRSELYGRVLTAIGDAGPTGTGFGGFMEAFRPYKTDGLGRYSWDMAHNSYLENALELGWIAAGAFLLAMLWIAARCLRGLGERARRTQYAACGLASTLLVGVHALVDFSMQIPAIPAAYAMLMGIAWAQSWPTRT
jgi:O-antigen ligase